MLKRCMPALYLPLFLVLSAWLIATQVIVSVHEATHDQHTASVFCDDLKQAGNNISGVDQSTGLPPVIPPVVPIQTYTPSLLSTGYVLFYHSRAPPATVV